MTPSSSSAASAGTSFAASDNPTNPVSIFLGTIPVAVYCYHAHNNDNQSVMASLAAAVATIIAIEAVPELVRRYIMRRSSTSTATVPSSPGSVMTSLLSASTASSQQQRDDLVGAWIRAAHAAGWVWNDHAEQFSRRPSTTAVPSPSSSLGMASASATTVASQQQRGWWAQMQPSAAEEEEEEDQAARASLMERGFDPDDLTKVSPTAQSRTPMTWYCSQGNIPMVRYLIARGVDCRRADRYLGFPMYMAAMYGHLEIIKLLSHDGGAHEDIRRLTTRNQAQRTCYSPLSIALHRNHFHVAYWLLLNFGWLPRWFGRNDGGIIVQERGRGWIDYYVDNGIIHDATMRSDLSPTYRNGRSRQWGFDKRELVLEWAQDIVTTHDNVVTLLLTGMIDRSNQASSSLIVFKGTSGILELIAHYVAYTQQQVRTPRQLLVLLPAFIDDTPFVEETEEERTRRRRQHRSISPPPRRRRQRQ